MRLFNTMTRKKEEFTPIESGKVSMYVCGPTVYGNIHIGNARPYVVFDTVRRYFAYKGYEVNYVQNYTDIDDKIIRIANEENITAGEVARRYIAAVEADAKGLNVLPATVNPRVTQEIDGIIEMIKTLVDKGYAYEKNGSVYFNTAEYEEYGKLSKRDFENQESGIRIEVDEEKNHPNDFILWKPKKEGEPSWPSPWSDGRPGWHIECSCMAKKYLGETIDIHAGGEDLVFPHHENEIAQSEAANGKPFANYWLHNGFINIDNQKMSKSKGNFFALKDIQKEFDYDIIRFFILTSHYRSPINFSAELMSAAKSSLERIMQCFANIEYNLENAINDSLSDSEAAFITESQSFKADFERSMEDDFNTADAIAAIFDFVRFINKNMTPESSKEFLSTMYDKLKALCDILGIEVKTKSSSSSDGEIDELVAARTQAKKDKNFALADEIRDKLTAMGVTIEDTRQGVRWYFNN